VFTIACFRFCYNLTWNLLPYNFLYAFCDGTIDDRDHWFSAEDRYAIIAKEIPQARGELAVYAGFVGSFILVFFLLILFIWLFPDAPDVSQKKMINLSEILRKCKNKKID